MAGLLEIPEEVIVQLLFPLLGHNDIIRCRRVCKTFKDFATKYLWTSKKGHQGKWMLEVRSFNGPKSLKTFLEMHLPPPSRLNFNLHPMLMDPFFGDGSVQEFSRTYGKYVTHLQISYMELPFMSAEQIGFYQSLVSLEEIHCVDIRTGGASKFEEKMNSEGSCLVPSSFQKLKSFTVDYVDCSTAFTTFIQGLKHLERISRFFSRDINEKFRNGNLVTFLQTVIEQDAGNKLKCINWLSEFLFHESYLNQNELLQLLVLCSDKGVKIEGIRIGYLDVLLCGANGIIDRMKVFDPQTQEYVYRVNYQRNAFVGNVVYSLFGLDDTMCLLELPYLEELTIESTIQRQFRLWQRVPKWPSLRKMDISVDSNDDRAVNLVNFLCELIERPKLKEFTLRYERRRRRGVIFPLPCPSNMARSFRNLCKLTLENCRGNSEFFAKLWEGLTMLEYVELSGCHRLGDKGFVRYSRRREAVPVFLKLEKLKQLAIEGIHQMTWLSDAVFQEVFCHLKLVSLRLSGNDSGKPLKVSVEGIRALLTGEFAESIEKLDFEGLHLHGLSEDGRSELMSCFRSSDMI